MKLEQTNKIVELYQGSREGAFVCETCCDNGTLQLVEHGCLIFHCPDHMTLCIKDGEVIASRTNGIRQ